MGTAPASAASYDLNTETTGAFGHGSVDFNSRTYLSSIHLRSVDTASDGHHVRIRLVTKRNDGTNAYWAWRANYGGHGNQEEWYTSLSDARGVKAILLQTCRAEGTTLLNCDNSPWRNNPYY
ncbi:hypothetical protein ABZS61_06935 [Streptomyces sp. NPDC005566]|uniref:hypothetical protein n=1 Tax=Streptomyces sp. NPDC005566 TaxID=3156886 RepID=UPI0033BE4C21